VAAGRLLLNSGAPEHFVDVLPQLVVAASSDYGPLELGVVDVCNSVSNLEHALVPWVVLAVMKLHFNFLDSSFDKLRQFS
jgi:hypothetical protein